LEEWLADNNDFPGMLGRIWHAFGCWRGAKATANAIAVAYVARSDTRRPVRFEQALHHPTLLTPDYAQELIDKLPIVDSGFQGEITFPEIDGLADAIRLMGMLLKVHHLRFDLSKPDHPKILKMYSIPLEDYNVFRAILEASVKKQRE
jgi:hypothetical protein